MEYEYYFPVFNLHITQPFQIGNTHFQMFTKPFFDDLFQKYNSGEKVITVEIFDGLYRKEYENSVIATVKSSLERSAAEPIVKREAEKSIDILKIITLAPFPNDTSTVFDLNYRLNYQMQSGFLAKKQDDISLLINKNFENHRPISLNTQSMFQNQGNSIARFSDFIKLNKDNELYNLIINAIAMFSFALSTKDLHMRVVSIMTILESLFLNDDEEHKMTKKTKDRLSKILPGTSEEKQKLKDLFERIYQIRHKMVHKAIKLPIDMNDLTEAQRRIIETLFYIMKINIDGITDKTQLISHVESIQ